MKRGRAVVFYLILAWMLLNPLVNQGFGFRSKWVRDWAMMRGVGRNLVDARFYQASPTGRQELDREKLAGRLPGYRLELVSDPQVVEAARLLCDVLGDGADVRVVARQASLDGWVPMRNGEENFCGLP